MARVIVAKTVPTSPAYAAACKLCHWHTSCTAQLKARDDLTLLPELGRSKRDALCGTFASVHDLAVADPARYVRGKKTIFPGIGPETLAKFHARARLLSTNGPPYAKKVLTFPARPAELFYDVETDPMQGVCYLHGFVVRQDGNATTEQYISFFADEPTPAAEEQAFLNAWTFIRERQPCALFYYSPYERTTLKGLAAKFPHVCAEGDVEALFASTDAMDLYEDDCRAMRVLLDALKNFPVRES
jgi:predicted RecB family nuclease